MIPAVLAMVSGAVQPVEILDSWTTVSTSISTPGSKAISSGSNRMMLARTSSRQEPGVDITGLSWGGQAMTLVEEENSTGGPDLHTALWRLDDADIAAAAGSAFVVTPSSGPLEFHIHAASYENVSQALPIVDSFAAASASAGDDPVASALNTIDGGLILGAIGINQGTVVDPDPDASFSNLTELLPLPSGNSHHLIGHTAADGSNFTITLSTSHLSRAHLLGLSLRPA